jgi:hypothetical protein
MFLAQKCIGAKAWLSMTYDLKDRVVNNVDYQVLIIIEIIFLLKKI